VLEELSASKLGEIAACIAFLVGNVHRCSLIVLPLFASQSQASFVSMPMIGGAESKREGPWPECVGLSGEECRTLIQATASDVRGNVVIMPVDSMMTMDFRTDRVRIFIDGNGIVVKSPHRG
jgi:hypothetical protein